MLVVGLVLLLSGVLCMVILLLFVHSLGDAHLGCFRFGGIMRKRWYKYCIQIYTYNMTLFLLGKYLGINLLGCIIGACLRLWGTLELCSKAAVLFGIPTSSKWVSLMFCILISTEYLSGFYFLVILIGEKCVLFGFNLHMWLVILSIFSYA